jgi:hypothetical protein
VRHVTVLLLAGLLVGCPAREEDDAPPIFCNSFGNSPTTSWSCTNCTAVNQTAAYDRDTGTATSLVPATNATGETAVLTITGPDFASGTTAGVFVKQPTSAGFNTTNVVETLLNGTVQETSANNNPNAVIESSAGWGGPTGFLGLQTTKAFDSVRFTTTNSWPSGQAPVYEVYEICSDAGET